MTRPLVRAHLFDVDGRPHVEHFLVDTGADRTVLCGSVLRRLRLATEFPDAGTGLVGIGGRSEHVLISTVIEFERADGGPARFRGQFAAFTDEAASDLSVLGQDVFAHLDVIVSRRRNQVLLLCAPHRYRVEVAP